MMRGGKGAMVLGAAVCSLAGGGVARAQTPAAVNMTVDATAAGTALEKVWPYHGYDEDNYTTTPQGQALLQTLGAIHSVPPHIRTHFLLNTGNGTASLKWGSTNAYTEDTNGNPVYSWTLMDGILDSMTAAGTLPLVEVGFMPHDLAAPPADPYQNSGIYTLDGHCFNPPKDFTKWGALIRAWATHVRDRYPNVESAWQWELWNEPDIGYWMGSPAQFIMLYDYTEAALHAVMPNASLGGPAVAGSGAALLPQFLQHCATGTNAVTGATGTRLDMISFHAKGGVAITGGHVEMNMGNQLRLHRTGFNAVAAVTQFKQTPIVITEADPDGCAACPVTTNPEDAYRNSPAYGAYEVAMMKRTLELEARIGVNVRGLLTWAFTFPGTAYFAGYRALTTNGIHLPVLNAFKLLGKLDGTRMPVTSSGSRTLDDILANSVRGTADVDGMATRNGQQVQVLVWNYHDDIVTAPATPVHLTVAVPPSFGSRIAVNHVRADDTHGDAYTVWVSQGSPAAPSPAQITAMQQAMEPTALEPARTVDVAGGLVALDFTLPRFGISLVTLTAATDADASTVDAALPRSDAATTADVSVGSGGGGGAPSSDATSIDARAGGPAVDASMPGSGGAGSTTGAGGNSGIGGNDRSGATGGSRAAAGSGGGSAPGSSGCSCRLASSNEPFAAARLLALALLGGTAWLRRRRRPS